MKTFLHPLTPKEEERALHALKTGSPQEAREARDLLIQHNLRLVAHIIKRYQIPDEDLDDLLSIGTIGLIKAVDSFDCSKGRLATYACKCIDNELLMLLRGKKKNTGIVSLYDSIGQDKEGNQLQLIDVVEDERDDMLDTITMEADKKRLQEAIDTCLSAREKEIITMRYGLAGAPPMTQNDVGKLLQISRSYVSRIEKKALLSLRQYFC